MAPNVGKLGHPVGSARSREQAGIDRPEVTSAGTGYGRQTDPSFSFFFCAVRELARFAGKRRAFISPPTSTAATPNDNKNGGKGVEHGVARTRVTTEAHRSTVKDGHVTPCCGIQQRLWRLPSKIREACRPPLSYTENTRSLGIFDRMLGEKRASKSSPRMFILIGGDERGRAGRIDPAAWRFFESY